jgi:hypothetical protein
MRGIITGFEAPGVPSTAVVLSTLAFRAILCIRSAAAVSFTVKPACAIWNCRTFRTFGTYVLDAVKRSLFLRCLGVLLSLALANGNAHAALHLGAAAHSEPCPEEHAHHTGPAHHQHQHDKDLACCCDCLGCSAAAYLAPELSTTPAELPVRPHYDARTASLSGRTLLPEPDPPRPGTLS